VAEDLNVAGMMKNRRLARHVADASFGEFRRQLAYKAQWAGPATRDCEGERSCPLTRNGGLTR